MCVHVEIHVALTHTTLHDTVDANLITKQANAMMPARSSRRGNPIPTHVTSNFSPPITNRNSSVQNILGNGIIKQRVPIPYCRIQANVVTLRSPYYLTKPLCAANAKHLVDNAE